MKNLRLLLMLAMLSITVAGTLSVSAQSNDSNCQLLEALNAELPVPFDLPLLDEAGCLTWIQAVIALVEAQSDDTYPLAGQEYPAMDGLGDGPQHRLPMYDSVWTADGWLWQPTLPSGNRAFHSTAFTIEEGIYILNAVECWTKLDADRDGQFDPPATPWPSNHPNSFDPLTFVGRGNGLYFVVDTQDNGQAWAMTSCNAGPSNGWSVEYVGPLGSVELPPDTPGLTLNVAAMMSLTSGQPGPGIKNTGSQ